MSDVRKISFISGVLTLFVFFMIVSGQSVFAAGQETPEKLAKGLQKFYDHLTSLTFTFNQVASSTPGRERHGSGSGYLYRPADGKSIIRWNYDAPDKQVIINNGVTISLYTEKDKQMLVVPAEELQSDLMYAFFSGNSRLLDEFKAVSATQKYHNLASQSDWKAFQLVPVKPDNQLKSVHLWVDGDYYIHRLIIEDHFNSTTRLDLTGIFVNALSSENGDKIQEIFSFQPPDGTEIISR